MSIVFFPSRARNRLHMLVEYQPAYIRGDDAAGSDIASDLGLHMKDNPECISAGSSSPRTRMQERLHQAGLTIPSVSVFLTSLACGIFAAIASFSVLAGIFLPLAFLFGAAAPFVWIENRIRSRALEFATDYPTMLLAAASSVKVGLTPYQALERSTRLLSKTSLVRAEVTALLHKIRNGVPREQAVQEFASSIRQPDLELFRSAFLLVLENGGRFSPTLSRLAKVSNNRAVLIRSAAVSTAGMRMTANILLAVTPIMVLMIAVRTDNFWDILLHNETANLLGSIGFFLIAACYGLLRHMSNFKV
jgi:Flp pilus assembly protein TadB